MKHSTLTCPVCDVGSLTAATFDDEFDHKGAPLRVEGLERYECDTCGADPIFPDQARRNHSRIVDEKRRADGMLTGQDIRRIRESLGLTQHRAAEIFGGGANAFSKYERGDVIQSAAMDRLLKAVMFVPGLLDFLCIEARVICQPITQGSFDYDHGPETEVTGGQTSAVLKGEAVVVSIADYGDRGRRCA